MSVLIDDFKLLFLKNNKNDKCGLMSIDWATRTRGPDVWEGAVKVPAERVGSPLRSSSQLEMICDYIGG